MAIKQKVETLDKFRKEAVKMLRSPDDEVKLRGILASRRLIESKKSKTVTIIPEAVPELIKIAGDTDNKWLIRNLAMMALGKAGDRRAIPVLRRIITKERRGAAGDFLSQLTLGGGSIVRSRAIVTLGELGHKSAIPTLVDALENEWSFGARYDAAAAIGRLGGDPRALKGLQKLRADTQYPRLRRELDKIILKCKGTPKKRSNIKS